MVYPLYDMNPGERAEVVWLISEPEMCSRLKALGFLFGEPITCVLKDSARSMAAYEVRGAVIALRTANTREILVRKTMESEKSLLKFSK